MKSQPHVLDDLPGYVLGTLGSGRRRVEAHLRRCPSCRDEYDSLQQTLDRLSQASKPVEPPADLEDRILLSLPVKISQGNRWVLAAMVAGLVVLGVGNLSQWWAAQTGPQRGLAVALLTGPSRGFGTLVIDPEDKKGILAVRDLAGLGHYRLWVVRDGQWTSAGGFTTEADGYGSLAMVLPGGVAHIEAFCVSLDEGDAYRPDSWVLKGSL